MQLLKSNEGIISFLQYLHISHMNLADAICMNFTLHRFYQKIYLIIVEKCIKNAKNGHHTVVLKR